MNKKILIGTIVLMVGSFSIGAFFNKSEASLSVIKAGVDEKGNPVCVNKSQVYLFKKNHAENKIIFFYHDASVNDASIVKSFPDEESTDLYWNALLKSW